METKTSQGTEEESFHTTACPNCKEGTVMTSAHKYDPDAWIMECDNCNFTLWWDD